MAILYSLPLIVVGVVAAVLVHQVALVPLFLALLVGIMPNPAAAGLHFCARKIAADDPVYMVDVRNALRDFWRPAAALYAFSLLSVGIIVANIIFYAFLRFAIAPFLELIWVYLLFTWLMVQIYLYPMLLTVEKPTVPLIYRNSLVLAFRKPVSSLIMLICWLFVLLLSTTTGLVIVLGLIVAAIMQQSITLRLLPTVGVPAPRSADEVYPTEPTTAHPASGRNRKRRRR